MSNVDRPNGLRVHGTIDGSPLNANLRTRPVDSSNATAIFQGDAPRESASRRAARAERRA